MTDHRVVSSPNGRNGQATGAEHRAVELADAERALRAEARKALMRVRDELASTRAELETTRAEALRLRDQLDDGQPDGQDLQAAPPVVTPPVAGPPAVTPADEVRTVARAHMRPAERWRTRAALAALPAILDAGEWLHALAMGRLGGSRCLVVASDRGLRALSPTGREHELIEYSSIESADIYRVRRRRLALRARSTRGDLIVTGRRDRLQRMQFDVRSQMWHARTAGVPST